MPYVVFSDETKAYFNYCSINKCRSLNVQKTMSSPIFIVSVLRGSCLLYSFQPPTLGVTVPLTNICFVVVETVVL